MRALAKPAPTEPKRSRCAKAGDIITEKAREKLAAAMGGNVPIVCIPDRVVAKTDSKEGQWFCITCGALPQNNMQASTHESEHPSHRLGWRGATGDIEEP